MVGAGPRAVRDRPAWHDRRTGADDVNEGVCMVGLRLQVVPEPGVLVDRIWMADCDDDTPVSAVASYHTSICCVRAGGVTTVYLRGPVTRATPLVCPPGTEFFGADFRTGAYLTVAPPAGLADWNDIALPTLPDGRILLGGQTWETPTPDNLDVFVDRLHRAGLLIFDPLVEDLRYGCTVPVSTRVAQARFRRAAGLSRRAFDLIDRTRQAADLLRAGSPIREVVARTGFYDQPQLTRVVRRLIGHTPGELARGDLVVTL
ncbi:helix-turn-helix domain-containing protein [Microlunatus parietis]|nr:helix-turn-helix domain-containing protein [Microlunatus parietis]